MSRPSRRRGYPARAKHRHFGRQRLPLGARSAARSVDAAVKRRRGPRFDPVTSAVSRRSLLHRFLGRCPKCKAHEVHGIGAVRCHRNFCENALRTRASGEGMVVPPAAREAPVGGATPGRGVDARDRPRPGPCESGGDRHGFFVRRGGRNGVDDHGRTAHSGTFPCLRLGSSSFFVRRNASPRVSILRVSAGSITSSM